MTPSFPTFSNASVIRSPITLSLLAEIEAICCIFSDEFPTVLADLFRFSTTAETALSTPLLRSIGFAPAVTFFKPSFTMD